MNWYGDGRTHHTVLISGTRTETMLLFYRTRNGAKNLKNSVNRYVQVYKALRGVSLMTDFEKLGICVFATIMVLTNVWGFMMLNDKLSAIIIRLNKLAG